MNQKLPDIHTRIGVLAILLLVSLVGLGGIKNAYSRNNNLIGPSYFVLDETEEGVGQSGTGSQESEEEIREETQTRKVSWYDQCYGTCSTANGETFDPEAFTTACWKEYPFGTVFRVCRLDGSKCIDVQCNDRGAFKGMGRFLDLSRGAFRELWDLSKGVSEAEINVIN